MTDEEAKEAYERMAKVWNSLPGEKLLRGRDAFKIRYCYCGEDAKPYRLPSCMACAKCGMRYKSGE